MIVRPTIPYGAVVRSEKTSQVSMRKMLHKAQKIACVFITGDIRTCPTRELEVIKDLTTLHLVFDRIVTEGISMSQEPNVRSSMKSFKQKKLLTVIVNLLLKHWAPMTLTQNWVGSARLNSMSYKVSIIWVPVHPWTKENDEANILATKSARMQLNGQNHFVV